MDNRCQDYYNMVEPLYLLSNMSDCWIWPSLTVPGGLCIEPIIAIFGYYLQTFLRIS